MVATQKRPKQKVQIASPKFKLLNKPSQYKVFHGGRGGGKSQAIATVLLLMGSQRPLRIMCAREIQKSLRDSVKRLLEDKIKALGMGKFYRVLEAEIRGLNGTLILFSGLASQTAESIKSFEGVDICWVEEAQNVSQFSIDVLLPTIRKAGSEVWFSYNPRYDTDPVHKMFVTGDPPPDSIVVQVNYPDNRFFPIELRKQMEWMRDRDHEKYLHIWMGATIKMSEARIFKNWKVEEFETPSNATIFFGGDWGFADDPSCLVGCWFDDATRTLYIDREGYRETGTIAELKPMYESVEESYEYPIIADSSRPEIIKELRKEGFDVQACKKGAGSVLEGIEFLQSFDIRVHPRCEHTIFELSYYQYKVDKHTSLVVEPKQPKDKNNHIIDSLRYATESRQKGMGGDWLDHLS